MKTFVGWPTLVATTRSRGRPHIRLLVCVLVATLGLVGPASMTATAAPSPKPTAVAALSNHRVLVTYDRALDAAALAVSNYAFATAGGVSLPVVAVSQAAPNQALVSTGAQTAVTYTMTKPKTQRPLTFTGSLDAEPALLGAEALSAEQVVLTFSQPVGVGADQPSSYRITVAGTPTTVAVVGAASAGDPTKILLTTAPLGASTYAVTVGDIKGTNDRYLDPTANTAQFTGSVAPVGPMLLSATPQGDTGLRLTFDVPLDPASATDPLSYVSTPGLFIETATLLEGGREVLLSTGAQYQISYTVTADVTDASGNPINPLRSSASFTGSRAFSAARPTVVSAASTGNRSVVVQFSKPMADSTADPSRFVIVQTNVNPEVGTVGITAAEWVGTDRLSVRLTTMSQAEVTYQVTASNVTDLLGAPLADRTVVGGVLVDPTSFTFPGTPPTGAEMVDTDEDGLFDHEETRGWAITVRLGNGETATREVTSSPLTADTDLDGLTDAVERSLNIDPRDVDTDDDWLQDYVEFNEFYSDPTVQDSDGDGLHDGTEGTFFLTSPLFDDTDGDQLDDGYEISVNRNPKVADLPVPVLRIGEVSMGLDVRFIETNGTTTRELDAKTVDATLVQSSSQEFSTSEASSHEASTQIATSAGLETSVGGGFFNFNFESSMSFETSVELSNTQAWTSEWSASSSSATERSHTDSLTTEVEVAADSSVTRSVEGATMRLGVFLESAGNVAFNVRNLQISALIADPRDPTRLTPIATLLPVEPEGGFNLGPLVPPKGPIIFSSTDIYPQLVDDLMRNPRGLVFRFANYDVQDEQGRNFAFTTQEVNDRTARIAIDFGGFDPDGDGLGEDTEILRVATGIIGRRVVDTNGDGVVDSNDRPVVFDAQGNQVGISLRDALQAAGLTEYDEAVTPSSSLSTAARQNSYSVLRSPDGTNERLFRIRGRQIQVGSPRTWEILTPTGIDRSMSLDEHILYPGTSLTLSFLADNDRDELPAVLESMHNCTDSAVVGTDGRYTHRDTDGDGLDDRFEVLIGWEVDLQERGIRDVRSRCSVADSDGDGRSDRDEAPGIVNYDPAGLVLFDRGVAPYVAGNAPRRDTSAPADPLLGWALSDPITDPTSRDTDADGLDDGFELVAYRNALRPPYPAGTFTPYRVTSPEHADSDADSVSDGLERTLGGDPRVADFENTSDGDHDGLVDALETYPYEVTVRRAHPRAYGYETMCRNRTCPVQDVVTRSVTSDPVKADTDGDGLADAEERELLLDPRAADTDADGLTDFEEVRGFALRDLGVLFTDPLNADTDNDKRSDGEEADRFGTWVVNVWIPDTAPRTGVSHPLHVDSDLDLLVDGDEQANFADPANYNTDGDRRTDFTEVEDGTRTNVPDVYVKLAYGSISVAESGDGGEAGEISWRLFSNWGGDGVSGSASAAAGAEIGLGAVSEDIGSISTSETVWNELIIYGSVREQDEGSDDCVVGFPGWAVPAGDLPGIMEGRNLQLGYQSWSLHRKVTCASGNTFEFTVNLSLRAT